MEKGANPRTFPSTLFFLAVVGWYGLAGLVQAEQPDRYQNQGIPQAESYVQGEVLVLLSRDVDRSGVIEAGENFKGVENAIRGKIQKRLHLGRRRQVLLVKLPPGKAVKDALAENWHRKDKRIITVEPNYRVDIAAGPNDPLFPVMWSLNNTGQTGGAADADIDTTEAWDVTTGSSDVIVAVIDTGIDYLHPDLADNMWTNAGEIPDNGIDDDGNGYVDDVYGYDFAYFDNDPYDGHGHGTHCAGTIGAAGNNGIGITGVNWRCKLMAVKFLNDFGWGSAWQAIASINYAVDNGAVILSNSWGGSGYSASLEAAIESASEQGVVFVAAAGNHQKDIDEISFYPACFDVSNIIAVAATDHADALASFSNYGDELVHLGAPGVEILSCAPNNSYLLDSGTSMAAPHVAGAAALLLANDPAMPLRDIKARLIWAGEPIAALDGTTISGNRLNAYSALTAPAGLAVIKPNGGESWGMEGTYQICWASIGGSPTVDIYLLKGKKVYIQLADDIPNEGTFSWQIPDSLPIDSDFHIRVDDMINTDKSGSDFSIIEKIDYYTENFTYEPDTFDLSNKSLLFTADGPSRYQVCMKDISALPTNPAGGTTLALRDDDYAFVSLAAEKQVLLYGKAYTSFYVGSNGYITFGSGDSEWNELLSNHFRMPRISALFDDFNPFLGGTVSWKQLLDRVAVTFENVPEYLASGSNTFQIEMFFDGTIRINWLNIDANDGLVGLSEDNGIPPAFIESNLSGYVGCNEITIHNTTQDTRHGYIQDAIDDAKEGDEIIIYPRIYSGDGNRDIDFKGKAITLRSSEPEDSNIVTATIIDCGGTAAEPHRGFNFKSFEDANSVIAGFTIINGYGPLVSFDGEQLSAGGAINCEGASPTITDCIIKNNYSDFWGGGIFCNKSDAVITNCTFNINGAAGGTLSSGGGIYNYDSSPMLTNCIFKANSANNHGGGMYNYDSGPILNNCTFTTNETGNGGGMYNKDSNPTVVNCTFAANQATEFGGGMYNEDANPKITNCIFWANTDSDGSNESAQIYGDTGVVNYSCIQDAEPNDFNVYPGIGNIDNNPFFVQPGYWHLNSTPEDSNDDFWVEGDYRLKSEAGRWLPATCFKLDLNSDGFVNLLDFGIFASLWYKKGSSVPADFDNSGGVDFYDLKLLLDSHLTNYCSRSWVFDNVTSPCIDAGDPNSDWIKELWPHGKCINMGIYGGTRQASMSVSSIGNIANLDYDNGDKVDLDDLAAFVDKWCYEKIFLIEDLSRNGVVDFRDFAIFADNWQE